MFKKIILSFSLAFWPILLFSQQLYTGEYTFNGLRGEGIFEFIEGPEGSIIKQGDFQFKRIEKDIDDNTVIFKTDIIGRYEENLKTGIWEYLDEKHQIDFEDVVEFDVQTDLNSQQIKLRANYRNGLPHGRWVFEENAYEDNKLERVSQADDFRFKDGDIEGRFQFRSYRGRRTQFIRGEVGDNGLMNGEWTFVYRDGDVLVSEIRNYENGFLLGLVKRDLEEDDIIKEVVFFQTINKLNKVNAGENSGFRISEEKFGLQFNDGFLSGAEQFDAQKPGNAFMERFITDILRYDEQFVNANGELIDLPIHTRRFVFELSRAEQRWIEDMPGKFDNLNTLVIDYAERNALRLNRQQSDSLSYAFEFFQFQAQKLEGFLEIMNLIRTKQIQYYDVEYLVSEGGLPFITESDQIAFEFEGEKYIRTVNYNVGNFENNFFEALNGYITQMVNRTNDAKSIVDQALSRIERDEDLRSLQDRIQEKRDGLDGIYLDFEDVDTRTEQLLQSVHDNILESDFNRLNERFAREENFDGKKDAGRVMLDLLEEMEAQYVPISQIYAKMETMDQLYMEETFNPFTYTRYDQRTKNRLYEAGEKLYEHYIEMLMEEQDYTVVKSWSRRIDLLFERMVELKDADTRRLERRLNRRLSPSRIESLLDL